MDSDIESHIDSKLKDNLIVSANDRRRELFILFNISIENLRLELLKLNDNNDEFQIDVIIERYNFFRHVLELYKKYRASADSSIFQFKYNGFFTSEENVQINTNVKKFILSKLIFDNVETTADNQIELLNIIYNSKKKYENRFKRWIEKVQDDHKNGNIESSSNHSIESGWWLKFIFSVLFFLSCMPSAVAVPSKTNITQSISDTLQFISNIEKNGITMENVTEVISIKKILPNYKHLDNNDIVKNAILKSSNLTEVPKLPFYMRSLYMIYKPPKETLGIDSDHMIDYLKTTISSSNAYNFFKVAQTNYNYMRTLYHDKNNNIKLANGVPQVFIDGIKDLAFEKRQPLFRLSKDFKYTTDFGMYSLLYTMYPNNVQTVVERFKCIDTIRDLYISPKHIESFDKVVDFFITTNDNEAISTCSRWISDIENTYREINGKSSSDNCKLDKPSSFIQNTDEKCSTSKPKFVDTKKKPSIISADKPSILKFNETMQTFQLQAETIQAPQPPQNQPQPQPQQPQPTQPQQPQPQQPQPQQPQQEFEYRLPKYQKEALNNILESLGIITILTVLILCLTNLYYKNKEVPLKEVSNLLSHSGGAFITQEYLTKSIVKKFVDTTINETKP